MNRHIKVGVKGVFCLWNSMCDTKKGSLLLRASISKVKATNTYEILDTLSTTPYPIVLTR